LYSDGLQKYSYNPIRFIEVWQPKGGLKKVQYTGWLKKATTNFSKNRIKDCQRD